MRILFIFLLSFNLYAGNGNEVGNGGDGLICKDKKIELFDFYEARQLKKYNIKFPKGNDWFQIGNKVIKRLEKTNKPLYKQYKKILSKIHLRLEFIQNAHFRDIKDSFEIAIPEGCKLEQLAIQQDNSKGNRKVFISQKLWEKLSIEQKAGLVVHEIIYEHFVNLGEKNSLKVREFNSLLFSSEILNFTEKDMDQVLRGMKLSLY